MVEEIAEFEQFRQGVLEVMVEEFQVGLLVLAHAQEVRIQGLHYKLGQFAVHHRGILQMPRKQGPRLGALHCLGQAFHFCVGHQLVELQRLAHLEQDNYVAKSDLPNLARMQP